MRERGQTGGTSGSGEGFWFLEYNAGNNNKEDGLFASLAINFQNELIEKVLIFQNTNDFLENIIYY
jgi:hypothetical protein